MLMLDPLTAVSSERATTVSHVTHGLIDLHLKGVLETHWASAIDFSQSRQGCILEMLNRNVGMRANGGQRDKWMCSTFGVTLEYFDKQIIALGVPVSSICLSSILSLKIYISDPFNWLITIHANAGFCHAILMRPREFFSKAAYIYFLHLDFS